MPPAICNMHSAWSIPHSPSCAPPRTSDSSRWPRATNAAGARVGGTGNPGCLMQVGGGVVLAGRAVTARHPVELLDEAYEREGIRR